MFSGAALFEQFADQIKELPLCEKYSKSDLLDDNFRLYRSEALAIYYAPLDSINDKAKAIFLGITPGWTQMEIAYQEARLALHAGAQMDDVCRRAKYRASFAGQMRANLIKMLDSIGLHHALSLGTCAELFGSASALMHTTSALRYPVFVDDRNYSGHRPGLLREPVLRDIIHTDLKEELAQVPDALVIPLGRSVNAVVAELASKDMLDRRRCLIGFPHPSGANGHRVDQFSEMQLELSRTLEEWFSR